MLFPDLIFFPPKKNPRLPTEVYEDLYEDLLGTTIRFTWKLIRLAVFDAKSRFNAAIEARHETQRGETNDTRISRALLNCRRTLPVVLVDSIVSHDVLS